MTKEIAIYGAGGLGREALALIHALPEWKIAGFFDDGVEKGTKVNGVEVLGGKEQLIHWSRTLSVVIAIGNPGVKKSIVQHLNQAEQLTYPVLIHPRALIMDSTCAIGKGSILTAGCVLTTNIHIGDHVLVNLNATIGHDCVIGKYSSIMPGANLAGAVTIGEEVLIGSGASVLSEVTVGSNSVIGAGAVVNHSIEANVTAVGIPARAMKRTS